MISLDNLTVSYGGWTLFDNISLLINPKDRIGLVGKNGAGKTTLLRLIVGEQQPTSGSISYNGECTIGYLPQQMRVADTTTLVEETAKAFDEVLKLEAEIARLTREIAERTDYESSDYESLLHRLNEATDHYHILGGDTREADIEKTLLGLGFKRSDFQRATSEFSGGWRMRIELAKLLLRRPSIFLLDEPTNHLDAESILWLEEHLRQYKGTVIAVTHDRYFLDNVAEWILELDRGEGIPWKGNYSSWLEQKTQRLAKEEKQASKRAKTLQRELDWVRQSPKGRQAKSKARLSSYERLLNEDQKEKEEKLEIYIPNGPRLGTNVIEALHVSKAFGDKLLYDDLNFRLPQNGIVGIIGPNGAGKTTIFRMIMGEIQPDSGTFEVGETVKIGYVDQTHAGLDPKKSIWENFSGGQELILMGGRQVNSRAYLSRFNFSGTEQNKLVGEMSGGERNRLHLAITLKEEGNVLLLDEPTNDLDVNTLRALEEGLDNFAGCAVIISHDRWFLDRVCTHILAFEGNSQVYFFEGSFSEYEENKKKRLGDTTPTRIRYKKLIRE